MNWSAITLGQVRKASEDDAICMGIELRAKDAAECLAHGYGGVDALKRSVNESLEAWVWVVDDKPVIMFGVSRPYLVGYAKPWFLSTELLKDNSRYFLRWCNRYVRYMLTTYGTLENQVDSRYTESIRWLKWMGFKVNSDRPAQLAGVDFYTFEKRSTCF